MLGGALIALNTPPGGGIIPAGLVDKTVEAMTVTSDREVSVPPVVLPPAVDACTAVPVVASVALQPVAAVLEVASDADVSTSRSAPSPAANSTSLAKWSAWSVWLPFPLRVTTILGR